MYHYATASKALEELNENHREEIYDVVINSIY